MKQFCAVAAMAAVVFLEGCSSKGASTAPTIVATAAPKIGAPAPQSPVNNQLLGGLAATLAAGTASVDQPSFTVQYRFQVFNSAGTLAEDSGLVGSPQWMTSLTLTPNSAFTWRVRGESQGFAGAWSDSGSFRTPDPPAGYNRPIGDWQSCASLTANKNALVVCVWNAVHPADTVSDMEYTKRVAWLLRGEGAGLLIKASGENTIVWQGYSFSASRICYPNGHIFKLLSDAGIGGANGPGFGDNDFVDQSLYVKAIDPAKP
jgi:hypothetical protein